MAAWMHQVAARVRGFLRPNDLDRDFDDELNAHLALAEADKIRQGMTRDEARRRARIELGGMTQLREAGREARGLPWLDTVWLDAKLGLRMLRKSWGLTLIGGLAMTLAIMIGVAVFSFFAWATGGSLPLDDGARVVAIETWNDQAKRPRASAMQDLERWQESVRSIVDLGAFRSIERNLVVVDASSDAGTSGAADVVTVAEMNASGFRLARVAPRLGRTLVDDDEAPGAEPVVVIGHDVWQTRFAANPDVVGHTLRLGGTLHTIVGVMPEGFAFPVNHHYWTPLRTDRSQSVPAVPTGVVFGRLAEGATLEGAQAELATLGLLPPLTIETPAATNDVRVSPYLLAMSDGADMQWVVRIALILVTLLLVPPCANIAILVYARTITRQEEFAARYALGANRRRIVGQLFIEMLVLAFVAAGAALLIVRLVLGWAVDALITQRADDIPFWIDLTLPVGAIVFAGILAVVAALIAGLVPALKATGRTMRTGLRSLGSRTGMKLGRTWTALVVAQVALTLAALPAAVEIGWGTIRQGVIGPGFDATQYLIAQIGLEGPVAETSSPTDRSRLSSESMSRFGSLQTELVRRLDAEPSLAGATMASVPGDEPWDFIEIDPTSLPSTDLLPARSLVRMGHVDEAFFTVYDIPVRTGRAFEAGDFGTGRDTVIVNRTFAQRHFGGTSPLGARIRHAPSHRENAQTVPAPPPWLEIVGVVEDRPAGETNGTIYHPTAAGAVQPASLALRVVDDPTQAATRLREIVTALDPTLLVSDVRTLDAIYHEQDVGNHAGALSLGAVMLSVLLLSAAGMYALMSFTVNQRRREIGIRSALGAQPQRLLAGIFKRALKQLAIGAACGIVVALIVNHFLPAEQLGGWPVPGVIPVATAVMLLVGLLAVAGPARRGLRVDPIEELRQG